jgi:hypothetical protein
MNIYIHNILADNGHKRLKDMVVYNLPEDWVDEDIFKLLNNYSTEEVTQFSYEEVGEVLDYTVSVW